MLHCSEYEKDYPDCIDNRNEYNTNQQKYRYESKRSIYNEAQIEVDNIITDITYFWTDLFIE